MVYHCQIFVRFGFAAFSISNIVLSWEMWCCYFHSPFWSCLGKNPHRLYFFKYILNTLIWCIPFSCSYIIDNLGCTLSNPFDFCLFNKSSWFIKKKKFEHSTCWSAFSILIFHSPLLYYSKHYLISLSEIQYSKTTRQVKVGDMVSSGKNN